MELTNFLQNNNLFKIFNLSTSKIKQNLPNFHFKSCHTLRKISKLHYLLNVLLYYKLINYLINNFFMKFLNILI